jgi:hypothetical protein
VWEADIQDSMCPDYGFERKRPATQSSLKAVGGTPYTREIGNTGHVFTFSWLNRSWPCIRRLKQFYEQYEDGFFTVIDHDGGGRHYVGRFTSSVSPVEVGNGQWSVENVTFEEMPIVPMLQYPNDFVNDAVWRYVLDDFGYQKVAASGTWATTARQFGATQGTSLDSPGTNAGDWAQYEYRGYGFQLWMLCGPAQGQANVLLDGTLLQSVDCYAATGDAVPQMVLQKVNVPLNIHRVQVTVNAARNGSSAGNAISWWALKVMR